MPLARAHVFHGIHRIAKMLKNIEVQNARPQHLLGTSKDIFEFSNRFDIFIVC